jgi:hypothetical protein
VELVSQLSSKDLAQVFLHKEKRGASGDWAGHLVRYRGPSKVSDKEAEFMLQVRDETNESYPYSNRLNGLAHV